jgi:hypothetical protein
MCEGRIKGAAIVATDVDFRKFLRVVFMILKGVTWKPKKNYRIMIFYSNIHSAWARVHF